MRWPSPRRLELKRAYCCVQAQRYKCIRAGFLQTVFDSQSHWMDRPLLPNRLQSGASFF